MLEMEVCIKPELAGDLASRIMALWPATEVVTSEDSVSFHLPINEDLDKQLQRFDEALKKLETVRGLTDLEVRSRNLAGNDAGADTLSLGRFLIRRPGVDVKADPEQIVLTLESGFAFGSGTHPSTILALTALEEYFSPCPGAPSRQGARVLDVGGGTGILSLAAKKLGAGPVCAIDTSPEAVAEAKKNVELNELPDIECLKTTADKIDGEYDLILANLVSSVLNRSIRHIVPRLAPEGVMIVAGFADSQTPQVVRVLTKNGLVGTKSYSRDGWCGLMLVRGE